MASIVQRGKSYSVVYSVWIDGQKKQKWETYHSYEGAVNRKAQIELIAEMEKARQKYQEGSLEEFLDEYVELYGRLHWSYSTYTNHLALIRNYIIPFMGAMQLSEFKPKTIAVLYQRMLNQQRFRKPAYEHKTITPQLLINVHKILHSAFEQAVLWEYVERNPFLKVKLPETYPKEIKILSSEELKILIQQCEDKRLRIALHLAFAGSLRKGEILALTWDDVDFAGGTITVTKTLKRIYRDAVDALGDQDILFQFPPVFDSGKTMTVLKKPKTKSSIRTIYLPTFVMDELAVWKEKQPSQKKGLPDLVLRYDNGRPLQEEILPHQLEKELLRLGLSKVSFHSIRHSSISYKLVLTGGDIKAVQGDSGHAQAEMITQRYGHVIDGNRKQCAESFQSVFYDTL